MPDIKFSQLTQINSAQSIDLVPIIDVSDELMSENGSNAIISVGDLTASFFNGLGDGAISVSKLEANPTFTGNVTLPATTSIGNVTDTELGFLSGLRNNIQYQLDNPFFPVSGTLTLGPGGVTHAPLRILSGTTLTSPIAGSIEFDGNNLYYTNDTPERQTLATTSFVTSAISNIVDGAPVILDTLNELAAAINDDANYATTVTTALSAKAPLDSPTFTGTTTFGPAATITLPNDTVTSAMIVNGTIVNADINSNAAIAGSKISPNFGDGNIVTTGTLTIGDTAQFTTRIGTTNVTPQSQALGNGGNAGALLGRFTADADSARLSFAKSRSTTKGGHAIVWAGNDLGLLSFGGSDGVKIVEAARIHAEVNAGDTVNAGSFVFGKRYKISSLGNTDWAAIGVTAPAAVGNIFVATGAGSGSGTATTEPNADDMPGKLVFSTTAPGAATPVERMRIDSSAVVTGQYFQTGNGVNTGETSIRLGYNRTGNGASKLEIYGSAGASATALAKIEKADTNNGILTISDTGTGNIVIHKDNAAGSIIFRNGVGAGTDRLTITSAGAVQLASTPSFSGTGGTQVATTGYVAQAVGAPVVTISTATARDISSSDVGKYIRYTNTSPITITLKADLSGVITGSVITFRRAAGAGVITLVADTGVTINDNSSASIAAGKTFSIKCIAAASNVWDFID